MDKIDLLAPGKINLHLRVLDRRFDGRSDGFHGIESLFQLVSLADRLSVSIQGGEGVCTVVSPLLALPPVNTITAAVEQFRSATGIAAGIRVDVDKLVPSGAGLGGGSSDAAATLRALDALFGTRLSFDALSGMAAKIGSDVPFFLSGGAALVRGRGELVRPIPARTDLSGILVSPDVHSSTAEAYRLVDRWQEAEKDGGTVWPPVSGLEAMYAGPVASWRFGNSFTGPVSAVYPVIAEIISSLRENGASFAEMSGSGSSVFGLFEDEAHRDKALEMIASRWKKSVKFLLLAS